MSIIAVSDVHLGYTRSDSDAFNNFLDYLQRCKAKKEKNIESIIICGDLLDMWRRDMSRVAIENSALLTNLTKIATKTYYVAGNHDYHLVKLPNIKCQFEIHKDLTFESNGKRYIFKHGYEFDPLMDPLMKRAIGFDALCIIDERIKTILSDFYDDISRSLDPNEAQNPSAAKKSFYKEIKSFANDEDYEILKNKAERLEKQFGSIQEIGKIFSPPEIRDVKPSLENMPRDNVVLVFGHTHKPCINTEENIINLGSWVNGPKEKSAKEKNIFLEIDMKTGKLVLYAFMNGNPEPIEPTMIKTRSEII